MKGLQMMQDIYMKGWAPKDSIAWGFNELVTGFYSGTCAMLNQDPDALLGIAEKMSADDFAVASWPVIQGFSTAGRWNIDRGPRNPAG